MKMRTQLSCILFAGLILNTLAFTLPKSDEEKSFEDDIAAIFLGNQLTGRFGDNEAGYSGQSADISEDSDILLQIIQGSSSIGGNPAPDDYNINQVTHAFVETDKTYENCADYTAEYGYECVPYYQCSNGSIITDGAGLIDIRNGFAALNPESSKCPGFLDVCCQDPDFLPPTAHPLRPKYTNARCGQRHENGLGANIHGLEHDEAQVGEWPSMCAVLRRDNDQLLFQCGASLLDTGVVLTAAHCIDKIRSNVSQLVVRCGEWDTRHDTEPYPHQDISVMSAQIHPEFNARNLANDFAVLFLEEDFVLNWNIDTICLPKPKENFDGRRCFATGWGKKDFNDQSQYQVVLKEIEVPTVDFNTCQDSLRQTRLGSRFRLHPSFMCAGGEPGVDTCRGDGGGPLMCSSYQDPDTYYQAGIVAWGIGCGGDTPGVYADVSEAVCWIDMVTSCHVSGGPYSHFGYLESECGSWLSDTMTRLQSLPSRIRSVIESQYQQCNVIYGDGSYNIDLSDFARLANKSQ